MMTCNEVIPHREARYASISCFSVITAKRFSSFLFFVDSVSLSKIALHNMSPKTAKLFCEQLRQADTADLFSEPDVNKS